MIFCVIMVHCLLLIVALNVVLDAMLVPGVAADDKSSMVRGTVDESVAALEG